MLPSRGRNTASPPDRKCKFAWRGWTTRRSCAWREEAWLGGGGPDGTYGIGEDDGEFGYTDEYHGNTFDFPGHLDHDVHRWLDDPTYDPKSLEDFDDNTPFDEFGRDLE